MTKKKMLKKLTQKNAILEKELGLNINEYGLNHCILDKYTKPSKKRLKRFYKQYKKYGFTDYETWCLDHIFAEWLYSRMYMYVKVCNVDLTFHKFEYKNKEYTQGELIEKIMKDCAYYIKYQYDDNLENEQKAYKKMKEACELWALVFPTMWW